MLVPASCAATLIHFMLPVDPGVRNRNRGEAYTMQKPYTTQGMHTMTHNSCSALHLNRGRQKDFVDAEKDLGRSTKDISAVVGYAGGTRTGPGGKVVSAQAADLDPQQCVLQVLVCREQL